MSRTDIRRRSKNERNPPVTPASAVGMTIGAILPSWENWKHSGQPDLYDGNHILFLRSNIETTGDPSSYHNRTGDMAMNVDANTAILIPVFTAQYHIGSYYEGTKIESEIGARRAVREHIGEGREMWAVMRKKSEQKYQNIVDDLFSYYVESPLFRLTVSERNPFRDKLREPIQAGTYSAVVGGYFI